MANLDDATRPHPLATLGAAPDGPRHIAELLPAALRMLHDGGAVRPVAPRRPASPRRRGTSPTADASLHGGARR